MRARQLWWLLSLSGAAWADVTTVEARLVDEPKPVAHCGHLEWWTVLRFEAAKKGDAGSQQWNVAVPCLELPRRQYGASAGTAGVLKKGGRYRLRLEGPPGSGPWGSQAAWKNLAIDELP